MAWKSAKSRPNVKTVVIISPHHMAEEPSVCFPESEIFRIPTGDIRVDLDIVRDLMDCSSFFSVNDIPHLEEHGIEVQLPFMRAMFPDARLVPILMGIPSVPATLALAGALNIVFSDRIEETLFVISSNITADVDNGKASRKADIFLSRVLAKDWRSMLDLVLAEDSPIGTTCLASLMASPMAAKLEPILLATGDSSGRCESEGDHFVHYAALAFV